MKRLLHLVTIGALAIATALGLGIRPGIAQSHPHVYLFRGLADVFSTGMDTLADELNRHGIPATSHSHTDWKAIADRAAADYKAKKEGPIILIGHSLGADAVMEMADYIGDKGVPVALVVPLDGTQSFPVPANVARVVNFTQRDYAYMRPGPGFRGSLNNVDLSLIISTSISRRNCMRACSAKFSQSSAVTWLRRLRGSQFQTVYPQLDRQGR